MSDWNRLFEACKDATGTEIADEYDAHLVVEELHSKIIALEKKLEDKDKKTNRKNFYDKSNFELRHVLLSICSPSERPKQLFNWVSKKMINVKQFEFLTNYIKQ